MILYQFKNYDFIYFITHKIRLENVTMISKTAVCILGKSYQQWEMCEEQVVKIVHAEAELARENGTIKLDGLNNE
jgi:hypothetical protein